MVLHCKWATPWLSSITQPLCGLCCVLRDKRVDTTLKTIPKKGGSQLLLWFFNLSFHFHTFIRVCIGIAERIGHCCFGRKVSEEKRSGFGVLVFECAFSTTLILKSPFLPFSPAHTVIGVFWHSTCHTIFFHSSLSHSCVLLFATLILWPLLMTSSASSSMQQATLCKHTLK